MRHGWSSGLRSGSRKYPDNRTLLSYLNSGYVMAGPTDSVISVTNRIIAIDTTENGVEAALGAAKALLLPPEPPSTATGSAETAPLPPERELGRTRRGRPRLRGTRLDSSRGLRRQFRSSSS